MFNQFHIILGKKPSLSFKRRGVDGGAGSVFKEKMYN